jgi:predicted MFS family arabinose efflux permease
LGGVVDEHFGVAGAAVNYLLNAAVMIGLAVAGSNTVISLILMCVIALLLMYTVSVLCVSLFMKASRLKHPKVLTLASSLDPSAMNIGISLDSTIGGWSVTTWGITSVGSIAAALSCSAAQLFYLTARIERATLKKPTPQLSHEK